MLCFPNQPSFKFYFTCVLKATKRYEQHESWNLNELSLYLESHRSRNTSPTKSHYKPPPKTQNKTIFSLYLFKHIKRRSNPHLHPHHSECTVPPHSSRRSQLRQVSSPSPHNFPHRLLISSSLRFILPLCVCPLSFPHHIFCLWPVSRWAKAELRGGEPLFPRLQRM